MRNDISGSETQIRAAFEAALQDLPEEVASWTDFRAGWLAAVRLLTPEAWSDMVTIASGYLAQAGFTILDRGWSCDDGGLSVIASDRNVLVVVYLRLGTNGRFGSPLEELGAALVKEIRHLATRWMGEHNTLYAEVRIDVIGLLRDAVGGYTIEHVRAVSR